MRPLCVSLLVLAAVSCSQPCCTAPTPTPTAMTAPALPILLAGQSNAVALRDVMPSLNVVQGGTGITAWLPDGPLGPELLADASRGPFAAFVWWQGEHEVEMSLAQHVTLLRTIISNVRARAGAVPIRIVEIADMPALMVAREAHHIVAGDPGNQLIPTADLARDDVHFQPAVYPEVAQRIYRSLQ